MSPNRIIKRPAGFQPYDWQAGVAREAQAPRHRAAGAETPVAEVELREAVQKAYREGEAAARAALEETTKAAALELSRAVAGLAQVRSAIYRESQADLLKLAVAIARRILHRELLVSPDILQSIVSVVLEKLDSQEVHRVRVHPGMAATLDHDLKKLSNMRPINVVPDPTLAPGACVFETGRGNIDAGIESQLSEIERGLADRLEI